MTNFMWSNLAFASKSPLRELHATFIAAPRELSPARLKQLVKMYVPKGNLVLGLSTQSYIDGFAGQPQFRTLQAESVAKIIQRVNAASPTYKIATLMYEPQAEPHIISKNLFVRYAFVNGSWAQSFHLRPTFFELAKLKADYELISPFTGESEAASYLEAIWPEVTGATPLPKPGAKLTAQQALALAAVAGRRSFDHTFQTGVVLARPTAGQTYTFIAATWNAVVPTQTAALHHGASREQQFSPPGDLNYYDTNHAEMALLVTAAAEGFNLRGNTLFINLLPCPTCARILSTTGLGEVVYQFDHSNGYAARQFALANIPVRRIIPEQAI